MLQRVVPVKPLVPEPKVETAVLKLLELDSIIPLQPWLFPVRKGRRPARTPKNKNNKEKLPLRMTQGSLSETKKSWIKHETGKDGPGRTRRVCFQNLD